MCVHMLKTRPIFKEGLLFIVAKEVNTASLLSERPGILHFCYILGACPGRKREKESICIKDSKRNSEDVSNCKRNSVVPWKSNGT